MSRQQHPRAIQNTRTHQIMYCYLDGPNVILSMNSRIIWYNCPSHFSKEKMNVTRGSVCKTYIITCTYNHNIHTTKKYTRIYTFVRNWTLRLHANLTSKSRCNAHEYARAHCNGNVTVPKKKSPAALFGVAFGDAPSGRASGRRPGPGPLQNGNFQPGPYSYGIGTVSVRVRYEYKV
jgi:hypothetical protein